MFILVGGDESQLKVYRIYIDSRLICLELIVDGKSYYRSVLTFDQLHQLL
jgi:hypothetical protein